MRKIIDGKRYDTDTATELGEYWNGLSTSDFRHVCETLYRTPRGKYFLCGEGGPLTKYAESCGDNSWSGGSRIIPLSVESARQWAEEHMGVDAYEAEFGEAEDAGSADGESALIRVPAAARDRLLRMAAERSTSIGAVVTELLG